MFNKIKSYFLIFLSLSLILPVYSFVSGNGSSVNPYQVGTCGDLSNVSNFLNSSFIQVSNIDCGVSPYDVSPGFTPIGSYNPNTFRGNYDGGNNTISNLLINKSGTSRIGLFGYTFGAKLENIYLEDVVVLGANDVGALGGSLKFTEVINSYVNGGLVFGSQFIGGLVGNSYQGNVSNSYSIINVNGVNSVGGLVGFNSYGKVLNSYSYSNVNGSLRIGGLVGNSYGGDILNSYSVSNVFGINDVGGLVGSNGYGANRVSLINNSFSNSFVNGSLRIGGLVGSNSAYYYNDKISNSYSNSDVFGQNQVGGLVGQNSGNSDYGNYAIIENSFSVSNNVSGVTDKGGLVGQNSVSGYSIITNSYWFNSSDNPLIGIGLDNHAQTVFAETDINYFNNVSNSPINGNWDVSAVWNFTGSDLPSLKNIVSVEIRPVIIYPENFTSIDTLELSVSNDVSLSSLPSFGFWSVIFSFGVISSFLLF
jgi:hypothetical protein